MSPEGLEFLKEELPRDLSLPGLGLVLWATLDLGGVPSSLVAGGVPRLLMVVAEEQQEDGFSTGSREPWPPLPWGSQLWPKPLWLPRPWLLSLHSARRK